MGSLTNGLQGFQGRISTFHGFIKIPAKRSGFLSTIVSQIGSMEESWPVLKTLFFRSNASTDSGLKSSLMMNANRSSEELEVEVPTTSSQPQFIKSENSHHHPLFKKNTTVISCHHHKGLKCTQMTLARHYSLSSLLEALPAASVDAEDLVDIKHASLSSLSSSSRCSDYDGYFYI